MKIQINVQCDSIQDLQQLLGIIPSTWSVDFKSEMLPPTPVESINKGVSISKINHFVYSCAVCKKKFHTKRIKTKFCSKECYMKDWRKHQVPESNSEKVPVKKDTKKNLEKIEKNISKERRIIKRLYLQEGEKKAINGSLLTATEPVISKPEVITITEKDIKLRFCKDPRCKKTFEPAHEKQVYCSKECSNRGSVYLNYQNKKQAKETGDGKVIKEEKVEPVLYFDDELMEKDNSSKKKKHLQAESFYNGATTMP